MKKAFNPGDNLLHGRIVLSLQAAGVPLSTEHLAARSKHTVDKTKLALNNMAGSGKIKKLEDGRWTI